MSLIPWLGGGLGLTLLLLIGSCSKMNDLREEIGEERQRCETSLQQLRADKLEAVNAAERDAETRRRLTTAELEAQMRELERRLHERDVEARRTEQALDAALRRADQEDKEWADMSVPSYLLPD